jgi:hypothetical protein
LAIGLYGLLLPSSENSARREGKNLGILYSVELGGGTKTIFRSEG